MHSECLVRLGQLVEILAEQDVLGVDIGEDQVNLCLVACGAASDHSSNNLQHGSDSGSSRNHTEVSDHIRGVDHRSLGPAYFDSLSDRQGRHVFRDVAGWVGLDEDFEEARLVVTRDWGVRSYNLL